MAQFARDQFASTISGYENLDIGRTADVGGTWTRHAKSQDTRWYIYNGRVHCGALGGVYLPATPSSANYYVECDYIIYSDVWGAALVARMDTSVITGYAVWYQSGQWVLVRYVNGGYDWIGPQYPMSFTSGTAYRVRLTVSGGSPTTVTVRINGVDQITYIDSASPITAAGKVGLFSFNGVNDVGNGKHIDNFVAVDNAAATTARARAIWFIGDGGMER
ncbi:MAG: hypothetical protein WBA46_06360 [Thermomicrobiales bacterium]